MKKLKENNSNKRKSQRQTCLVPVDGKQGSPFDKTQTIDISKGGIGFISPTKISLNKEIAMEIELSPEGETVIVVGKVRWVHPIADSDKYRIGLSFEDVLSGSKSRLNQYFQK